MRIRSKHESEREISTKNLLSLSVLLSACAAHTPRSRTNTSMLKRETTFGPNDARARDTLARTLLSGHKNPLPLEQAPLERP